VKIRKIIPLLTIALLFGNMLPGIAAAQSTPNIQLQSVKISLFPEVNHPSVYTIYEIELGGNVSDPKSLIFQIPINVQNYYAAYIDQAGLLHTLDITVSLQGKWRNLQITSPTNKIRLEVDDPNLFMGGNNRFFRFEWFSAYDVESLNLQIHPPYKASNIESTPGLEKLQSVEKDVSFYSFSDGPIPAKTSFSLNLWYTRSLGTTAFSPLKVEAVGDITNETLGRAPSPIKLLIWFITVAFALIIVVVLYYIWFRKSSEYRRESLSHGVGIMNPEKQAVFCHECGMRSRPGDTFCSNCATELRKTSRFS